MQLMIHMYHCVANTFVCCIMMPACVLCAYRACLNMMLTVHAECTCCSAGRICAVFALQAVPPAGANARGWFFTAYMLTLCSDCTC
jgi:hypothetical protein